MQVRKKFLAHSVILIVKWLQFLLLFYLCRAVVGKFDAFSTESLISREVLPIQECEGKVNKDFHPFRGIPPDEVYSQNFLRARESYGPFLIAVNKLLGCYIPVQISCYGFRHYKGEDVSVPSVGDFGKAVEQRHSGS